MSLTNRELWIDPSETEREGTKLFGHLLLVALLAIVVIGLIWAHYAVLDEITRGEGKVVASSQTQVIQSVKGGKIKALNVREGDIVQPNQVVAVLDNTELSTNEAGYCTAGPLRAPWRIVPQEVKDNSKKIAAYWNSLCEKYPLGKAAARKSA